MPAVRSSASPLPGSPAAQQPPGLLVLYVLCLILVLQGSLVFFGLWQWTFLRGDLTFPENSVVLGAWQAAGGAPVYADWQLWPHRFAPYGPLLYYPPGWAARWLQGDAQFTFLLYQLGRWISLGSLLWLAVLAAACLRRAGLPLKVCLPCGLGLLVAWPGLVHYVISFRPDAPMVTWAVCAVWIALGGLQSRGRCAAVIVCLWLSAGYKPAAWAAPLLIAAMAWRSQGPRVALGFGVLYVAGVAVGIAVLQFASGSLFVLNQTSAMVSGWALPPFLTGGGVQIAERAAVAWSVLLRWLLGLAAAVWLLRHRDSNPKAAWIAGWFLLAVAIALLQSFKQGSDINYWLEAWVLSGVVAPLAAHALWLNTSRGRVPLMALAVFALLLPTLLHSPQIANGLRTGAAIRRIAAPLNPLLNAPAGSLLFDTAFTRGDLESHAVPDALIYHLMVKQGRIDPQILIDKLATRQAPALNLSPVSWFWLVENPPDPRLGAAFQQNYKFETHGAWHVGSPQ